MLNIIRRSPRTIILIAFLLIAVGYFTTVNGQASTNEVNDLIKDMQVTNFGEAMKAQNELVKIGEPAIPALQKVLASDPDSWDRVKAINVLGRIGTEGALSALLEGIGDRDAIVRQTVESNVSKLDLQGQDIIRPLLVKKAVDTNFTTRAIALDMLHDINTPTAEIAAGMVELLQTGVTQDSIILTVLSNLGAEAGNVIPDLQALLADANQTDQLRLIEVITAIGGEAGHVVLPQLQEMLLSSDATLRNEAIWGMRRLALSGTEMVAPVERLLTDEKRVDFAIEVLAELAITQPQAVKLLTDIVADTDYSQAVRATVYTKLQGLVPQLEWHLNRGLVAVDSGSGVFLSWRLLGTEAMDIGFNVYRDGTKLNSDPITTSTNYLDGTGTTVASYYVRAVVDGVELAPSETVTVWEQEYLSIPLNVPANGLTPNNEIYRYSANDASAADLDGDGEYEIVLKWDPSNSRDNASDGYTGNVFFDAYKLDGTHMWRIDLGKNIRAGAHYTQFMIYDLDGDGKAEIVMKTADGTVDGVGNVIGNPTANYVRSNGRILEGPEYLTVFSGETGAALQTIDYKPARGNVSSWGDSYGNRVDRFLAAIAYLDGVTPSVVMARGYYTRTVLVAYNWRDGQLEEVWTFDTNDDPSLSSWRGQGNHQLSVADVDGDGRQEIIYGSITIDDDGTGLYNSRLNHGDALHVADHIPGRVGLEIYGVHEAYPSHAGKSMRDARTGELLWGVPSTEDIGRGVAANIDPRSPGSETWGVRSNLMDVNGKEYSRAVPAMNFLVWWDGDLQRELLDGTTISKYDWENDRIISLLTPRDIASNNGSKATPTLSADLFGDWREEVVWRSADNKELRIYTTTDLTEHRLYTWMHDAMYRVAIAWQNVAYNQPPHPSLYVGDDMEQPDFNPGLIINILEQYASEFAQ